MKRNDTAAGLLFHQDRKSKKRNPYPLSRKKSGEHSKIPGSATDAVVAMFNGTIVANSSVASYRLEL